MGSTHHVWRTFLFHTKEEKRKLEVLWFGSLLHRNEQQCFDDFFVKSEQQQKNDNLVFILLLFFDRKVCGYPIEFCNCIAVMHLICLQFFQSFVLFVFDSYRSLSLLKKRCCIMYTHTHIQNTQKSQFVLSSFIARKI